MRVHERVTIAGRDLDLHRDEVERAIADVLPEPLTEHFVVVGGRRFPPKQVIAEVTGLDRADFTTHQARSVLRRLGFTAGRRSRLAASPTVPPLGEAPPPLIADPAEVERYRGQWVAVRDGRVLVGHDDPREVWRWLTRHDEHGLMLRVLREGETGEVTGPW